MYIYMYNWITAVQQKLTHYKSAILPKIKKQKPLGKAGHVLRLFQPGCPTWGMKRALPAPSQRRGDTRLVQANWRPHLNWLTCLWHIQTPKQTEKRRSLVGRRIADTYFNLLRHVFKGMYFYLWDKKEWVILWMISLRRSSDPPKVILSVERTFYSITS